MLTVMPNTARRYPCPLTCRGFLNALDFSKRLCLMTALVLGLGGPAMLQAATLYVSAFGFDSPTCGAPGMPCRSISQAIDNAQAEDTLIVGPGHYGDANGDGDFKDPGDEDAALSGNCHCLVNVDKPLTILSSHGAKDTVIDAAGSDLNGVKLSANHIIFGKCDQGFTIKNALGDQQEQGRGLYAQQISKFHVAGNLATNNKYYGFLLFEVTDGVLRGNVALDNKTGVRIDGASILVENNHSRQNTVGFSAIELGGDVELKQNHARDNLSIGVNLGAGVDFIGNTVNNNGERGISVGEGEASTLVLWNNIYDNALSITNNTNSLYNCGLTNMSQGTVRISQNYWGSPSGPGPDPADAVCDHTGSASPATPFVPTPFPLPAACRN